MTLKYYLILTVSSIYSSSDSDPQVLYLSHTNMISYDLYYNTDEREWCYYLMNIIITV